jgi:hypothetical protein
MKTNTFCWHCCTSISTLAGKGISLASAESRHSIHFSCISSDVAVSLIHMRMYVGFYLVGEGAENKTATAYFP